MLMIKMKSPLGSCSLKHSAPEESGGLDIMTYNQLLLLKAFSTC